MSVFCVSEHCLFVFGIWLALSPRIYTHHSLSYRNVTQVLFLELMQYCILIHLSSCWTIVLLAKMCVSMMCGFKVCLCSLLPVSPCMLFRLGVIVTTAWKYAMRCVSNHVVARCEFHSMLSYANQDLQPRSCGLVLGGKQACINCVARREPTLFSFRIHKLPS